MSPSRLILFSVLILAVAGVSACGRRAPLDRPIDAQFEKDRAAAREAGQPDPAKPPAEMPDRRFILDGLID